MRKPLLCAVTLVAAPGGAVVCGRQGLRAGRARHHPVGRARQCARAGTGVLPFTMRYTNRPSGIQQVLSFGGHAPADTGR